jgi:hypothetical protein
MTTAPVTDANAVDRSYPPVAWLSTAALCLVISGGIILASYAPRVAPHSVTVTLLVAGLLLLATSVTMLLRIKEFSWTTFRSVYKWAQLAYLITAGMIEFAFAHDHTRGSSLVIVTLMLVVFCVSVPINIAFTTARYANPD